MPPSSLTPFIRKENPALWTGSEIKGSAGNNQPEYWSVGLEKKRTLNFRIFSMGLAL
jgi:hypothetical protein